jgi:hypothetical protein
MGGNGSGTPKAEIIKLDGTQIDKEGKVTRSNFFDFLNLPVGHKVDLDKILTGTQALQFRNFFIRMKIGTSAAIPMLCSGPKCPNKLCAFHSEQNWCIGDQCPLEAGLIIAWTRSWMEDLNVDPENMSEMVLINKLVELDMIDYRANLGLSGAVDEEAIMLVKTNITTGASMNSETSVVHPLLEIKEKIQRMRGQILECLGATRKEKWKKAAALKQRDEGDLGKHFTDLKKALADMRKAQKTLPAEVIKNQIESGVLPKDELDDLITDADWIMTEES